MSNNESFDASETYATENDTNQQQQETEMQDEQEIAEMNVESDDSAIAVEASGESVDVGNAPAEAKAPKGPPAWEAFTAALAAHAQVLGNIETSTQNGFVKFVGPTGHKIYVSRSARGISRIDTTLPVLGQPGTLPLEKANGRVTCHLQPDLANVEGFLLMLADESVGKIPAPKRAPKRAAADEATATATAE